jgi:hypothetical protein
LVTGLTPATAPLIPHSIPNSLLVNGKVETFASILGVRSDGSVKSANHSIQVSVPVGRTGQLFAVVIEGVLEIKPSMRKAIRPIFAVDSGHLKTQPH